MNNLLGSFSNILKKIRLPKISIRLPHFQIERALLIGFLLLAGFTVGNVALVGGVMLPAVQEGDKLTGDVQKEQAVLLAARQLRESPPEVLETRVASNQAVVERAQNSFLDNAQLQAIANQVYEGANLSGIALTQFSISGGPEDSSVSKLLAGSTITPTVASSELKPTAAKPTAKPTVAKPVSGTVTVPTPPPATRPPTVTPTPIPPFYQIRYLHLQAQGTSQRLVNFMARMQALQVMGVTIKNLSMDGDPDWSTLTLDLALYVMPSAKNPLASGQAKNNAMPVVLSTPIPPPTAPYASPTPHVIVLPFGSSGLPTQVPIEYVVQSGDTLYTLAERFHVPAQEIVNRNALTNFELTPGQKLLIPVR